MDTQMTQFMNDALRQFLTPPPTREQQFRGMKIIEGDRVRLTAEGTDASQLEGIVIGIKVKDEQSQVRIKGFDHTGAAKVRGAYSGGQHVWFPVSEYKVEVLHRAFRWTSFDEILIEIARYSRPTWESLTETVRERIRGDYRRRIERIQQILADSEDKTR